jgi:hypothetical protein
MVFSTLMKVSLQFSGDPIQSADALLLCLLYKFVQLLV